MPDPHEGHTEAAHFLDWIGDSPIKIIVAALLAAFIVFMFCKYCIVPLCRLGIAKYTGRSGKKNPLEESVKPRRSSGGASLVIRPLAEAAEKTGELRGEFRAHKQVIEKAMEAEGKARIARDTRLNEKIAEVSKASAKSRDAIVETVKKLRKEILAELKKRPISSKKKPDETGSS